jgi:hypothetical protein
MCLMCESNAKNKILNFIVYMRKLMTPSINDHWALVYIHDNKENESYYV